MKVLDKTVIDNTEYICIQKLSINNKIIYILYNSDEKIKKIVEENDNEYRIIVDEEILNKIYELNNPKTDVVEDE